MNRQYSHTVYSELAPFISLNPRTKQATDQFLQNKVGNIFKQKNICSYAPLNPKYIVSYYDFGRLPISYFYGEVFRDLKKESGKVVHIVKYCITFDSSCAPFREFTLNGQPVLIFIYVDLSELLKSLSSASKLDYRFG